MNAFVEAKKTSTGIVEVAESGVGLNISSSQKPRTFDERAIAVIVVSFVYAFAVQALDYVEGMYLLKTPLCPLDVHLTKRTNARRGYAVILSPAQISCLDYSLSELVGSLVRPSLLVAMYNLLILIAKRSVVRRLLKTARNGFCDMAHF